MNTYTDIEWQEALIFDWETVINWAVVNERYAKSIIAILESEERDMIADLEDRFAL